MILTISIHTFRVEGDGVHMKKYIEVKISIHTFRVEGDQKAYTYEEPVYEFQSTPSVWKVTENVLFFDRWQKFQSTPSVWKVTFVRYTSYADTLPISIHTFRVEGDSQFFAGSNRLDYSFQSTPSVWKVTQLQLICNGAIAFQSTPSVWKVTLDEDNICTVPWISIHTFRVEGD